MPRAVKICISLNGFSTVIQNVRLSLSLSVSLAFCAPFLNIERDSGIAGQRGAGGGVVQQTLKAEMHLEICAANQDNQTRLPAKSPGSAG